MVLKIQGRFIIILLVTRNHLCIILFHMFDQGRLLLIFHYKNSTWILSYINANIIVKFFHTLPAPKKILVSLFLRSDHCQTFISQGESNDIGPSCSLLYCIGLITAQWWSLDLLRENRTNFQKLGIFLPFILYLSVTVLLPFYLL